MQENGMASRAEFWHRCGGTENSGALTVTGSAADGCDGSPVDSGCRHRYDIGASRRHELTDTVGTAGAALLLLILVLARTNRISIHHSGLMSKVFRREGERQPELAVDGRCNSHTERCIGRKGFEISSAQQVQAELDAAAAPITKEFGERLDRAYPEYPLEEIRTKYRHKWVALMPTRVDEEAQLSTGRIFATAERRDVLDQRVQELWQAHPQLDLLRFYVGDHTFLSNRRRD